MSEIATLPQPKSKTRRLVVLLLGGLIIGILGILSYLLYEKIFHNREIALTAWAITQGVANTLLSPGKILGIFKA